MLDKVSPWFVKQLPASPSVAGSNTIEQRQGADGRRLNALDLHSQQVTLGDSLHVDRAGDRVQLRWGRRELRHELGRRERALLEQPSGQSIFGFDDEAFSQPHSQLRLDAGIEHIAKVTRRAGKPLRDPWR